MTFDQMVLRSADPAEPAPTETSTPEPATEPSTTSFLQWCTLDATGRALVCAKCDVSWLCDTGETCWVCGDPGRRVGDLRSA